MTPDHCWGQNDLTEMAQHRDGDPPVLIGSAVRAEALLGWRPARSALETQIADAWNWMMKGRQ